MSNQKSVKYLLNFAMVQELALASNLRYGTAIYERGAVEFIENTPKKVEAWVGGLDGSAGFGHYQPKEFFKGGMPLA